MKKITSILLALIMVLSIPTGIFASEPIDSDSNISDSGSVQIRQITEQEYLKSLAEKNNISIEEAKILNEQNTQDFLNSQNAISAKKGEIGTNSIKIGTVVDRVGYATVYKRFSEQKLKIEVGVPCKVSMGNTAQVFISGSEGEAYVLECGGGDFVFKKAFATGEISGLQSIVVRARGNYEMTIQDAVTAGIEIGSWTRTVNNYKRSPVREYSFTEYLNR